MMLHRKPAIGSLDEIAHADAGDLAGELLVAERLAHMLDHRIAEHHVEGFVAKRELAPVGENPGQVGFTRLHGARKIDNRHLRPHLEQRPIRRRSTHVQNASAWRNFQQAFELGHAPGSEAVCDALSIGRPARRRAFVPRRAASLCCSDRRRSR